jgi:hypothetical protein
MADSPRARGRRRREGAPPDDAAKRLSPTESADSFNRLDQDPESEEVEDRTVLFRVPSKDPDGDD